MSSTRSTGMVPAVRQTDAACGAPDLQSQARKHKGRGPPPICVVVIVPSTIGFRPSQAWHFWLLASLKVLICVYPIFVTTTIPIILRHTCWRHAAS